MQATGTPGPLGSRESGAASSFFATFSWFFFSVRYFGPLLSGEKTFRFCIVSQNRNVEKGYRTEMFAPPTMHDHTPANFLIF